MTYAKQTYAAALFDLDGVIIDTESAYSRFWSEVGRTYFPQRPDFADEIKGSTLVQIFNDFFARSAEQRKEVAERLRAFEAGMNYAYIAGAEAFVARLREAGVPTAVVTSSDREKMARIYAVHPGFETHFSRIFTAEDAGRSKPAPDCYLNAAKALGVDIAQCVVFEDSKAGLAAARASGAHVVGLATTLPESVVRPLCDDCIANFENIE